MPAWNTTVQDYSPLITYSPVEAWRGGSTVATSNPGFYEYFNDDYKTTNITNATASFMFNGTGVWVYGSKGRDHGEYTVLLDGHPTVLNGSAPIPLFQTLLFGVDHLSQGQHILQIINTERNSAHSNIDVDFITWEQSRPDDTLLQHFIKVTAETGWDYGPSWSLEQTPQAPDKQLLSTSPNSTVTLTFSGSHIDIYGLTNAECGSFVASIDGDEGSGLLSCYTPESHSHVLLYSVDTSGLGVHNLTITSKEDQGRKGLVLSHAIATTSINFQARSDPPLSGPVGSRSGPPNARMALIITFSVLSPLLALFLLYLVFVRKQRVHRITHDKERKIQLDEELGHANGMLILPYGRRGVRVDLPRISSWADGKLADRLDSIDSLEGSFGQEPGRVYEQERPPPLEVSERRRSNGLKRSQSSPPQMSSQAVPGKKRHVGITSDHTRATRAAAVPRLIIPLDTNQAAGHRHMRDGGLGGYGFGRARSSPMTPPSAPQTMSPPPFPEFPTPLLGLSWNTGRSWREKNRRLSHPPPPAYEQAMANV